MGPLRGLRRPRADRLRIARSALGLFAGLTMLGCTANTTKKTYVLAEKLWTDGKYPAAVAEFEKVIARDPGGALGLQALHRAATTQAYFLSEYGEAVRKFQRLAEVSPDAAKSWEAQIQIGEILFSKLENHEQSIQHYRNLLRLRPEGPETAEFIFRIAKSHFFLWQFDDAVRGYRDLIRRFPNSQWSERAAYEIGITQFTRGEQHPGGKGPGMGSYQEAIESFQRFIAQHPGSALIPQARFGIASCLEELDQLDAAYSAYEGLKASYPSPNVILIKLHRIRERKAQRSR